MSLKKIRAAVIGVGHLGKFHAQKYAQIQGAELIGVVDASVERAKEIAKENDTQAFTSYQELFGKVDAVSIATPTESHCRIGLEFLSRGIDVLIEKPIAMNLEEADRLIKAAEKSGALIQVGHLERFNAAVLALNGRISSPLFIESFRLSPFPNRSTDVDVILDVMIHDIDIIHNLVNSDIGSIDAIGIPVISGKIDLASVRIKFMNGCVANVTASRVSRERVRKINIYQHDSHITIDYASQHISIANRVPAKDGKAVELVEEDITIEKTDSLLEEIRSFVHCSATRKTPLVSGVDGKKALEIAGLIQAAAGSAAV